MAVLGLLSVALDVPDLKDGLRFYTDAGLMGSRENNQAVLHCEGQDRASVVLFGGAPRKRLHHVRLRVEGLNEIVAAAAGHGGRLVEPPVGASAEGAWIVDPHGMLFHLCEHAADPEPAAPARIFDINGPARIVRRNRSAILPGSQYRPVRPLRLGHVLLFTPDVMASVAFVTNVLGMGLADHAEDVIAFTCARANSDHHVIAFAKSDGVGFHHASFQVSDPDEVGRGGRALAEKSGRGDWGFGRHTIGSNFFHYIQDPWGSWFEYYSDMDYIEDYSRWVPRNYAMADSLASWGPEVPRDFVHNYETDSVPFGDPAGDRDAAAA